MSTGERINTAKVHMAAKSARCVRHSGVFLYSHRRLLVRITQSELAGRFAGSIIGVGWAALTPLMLLAIYACVYLVIFRVRVPTLSGAEYVVLIFSGLVPFLMTSEALVGGVASVVANKSVLSNTVFPIDLAPVKAVLMSQVTMAAGMAIVLISLLLVGRLSITVLLLPVLWALHILALIGLLWVLALVNLVLRDLQNFIGVVVMFLMIASPIAYTPDMVPEAMKPLLLLNPLAYFVVAYQDILVFGRVPETAVSITLVLIALVLFGLGGIFFARAKPALIDYV